MDSIMYYFNGNQSLIVCEKKIQVREEESCEVEFEFWIYQYEIMIFQKKKIAEGVKQWEQNGGDFFFPFSEIWEW